MATEFAMPVQQFTTSPSQYTLYNNTQSQPISPINSANATPGASPTSPRTAIPAHVPTQNRQLRPQKSPMYVPAVLRPTDPPRRAVRPAPLTPPQSMHGSFDDLENTRALSRRSTEGNGKLSLGSIVESEFNIEGLGKVTASPTRDHWKPDSESHICDEPSCQRVFSYFNRRHHCRRCGNIFCEQHSKMSVPLDQDANYHPNGAPSRSCQHCYGEYRSWHFARSSRSNSDTSDLPATPTVNCSGNAARMAELGQKGQGIVGSVAASLPRFDWSTF